jgi:hypothetical protein
MTVIDQQDGSVPADGKTPGEIVFRGEYLLNRDRGRALPVTPERQMRALARATRAELRL